MAKKKQISDSSKKKNIILEGDYIGLESLIWTDTIKESINNNEEIVKGITLFDHLSNITEKKIKWNKLRDVDKKTFEPYMILLWLGMSQDLASFIDEIQWYGIMKWTPEQLYAVLLEYLPQQKFYIKYIKGNKEGKYNSELIQLLCGHFKIGKRECNDYLDIFFASDKNKKALIDLIEKYGKKEKEIEKLMIIK